MADTESQDPLTDEQWATPLGQAFRRVIEDAEFAHSVAINQKGVLADYELDAGARQALAADARQVDESEVDGYLYWWRANFQTPTILMEAGSAPKPRGVIDSETGEIVDAMKTQGP